MKINSKIKIISKTCIAAGLLCATGAYAGTAEYDFNDDPIAAGLLTFYGSGMWQPSGGASGGDTDGYLVVTAGTSQSSRIIFNDFDGGKPVKAFTFEADFRVGNGSENPADGFSVSYARVGDPVIDAGTWAQGQNCEASLAEEGTQTGISIGFDAWNSGGTAGSLCDVADQSIGVDVAALTVRVDKILVAQFPLPTRNGTCDDVTSLQTGAYDGTGDPSNLCWAKLKVELTENAQLNVWWKGKQLLTNYQTEYFPSPGVLVFGGRCGDAWQNQHVDNIKIATVVEEADTEKPTVPANLTATSIGAGRVALSWTASTDNSGRVAYEVERDGTALTTVLQTTSYVDFPGQANKQYTYRVRAKDVTPNYSDYASIPVTTAAETTAVGTVKVEIFDGISGTAVADLTGNAKFTANTPDRAAYVSTLQAGSASSTSGWNGSFGDNLGVRMTGTITPLETAQYDFFIRSDDASAFYLNQSGSALPDPLVELPLIEETGCCATFFEPIDGDASTTVTPVSLTAGQSYGFVVLMKEGGGGDGVAVAMRKVGDTTAAANLPPVGTASGTILKGTADPIGATLGFSSSPANKTTFANEPVTFKGVVTNSSFYTTSVWYQWLRDNKPIVGATTATYSIPAVTAADNNAKFALVAGTLGICKTSAVATLTVNADTRKPLIAKVSSSESLTAVDVLFSEPVTAPSATTAANYTFSGGLTASAATLLDQFTVRVTTSKQTEGALYTVTVNNVADKAGNVIAANSAYDWKSFSLIPSRARMEVWTDITGTAMSVLYDDPKYAEAPNAVVYVPGMNSTSGYADNYGARVTGYLIPKESGSYHFFLYSDDASELYLSNNDVIPTIPGATPIAQETDCCDVFAEPGTMNDDATTSPTTASPISLTAGSRYAMVAMLKEGGGGDYVQVAMRKVGDTNAANTLSPLSDLIYWYGPEVNVLAAGNTIAATSTNSPAAEQAPNAIDGDPSTKYLNFDKLNAGFTVTPAKASTIRGIALTSANDAPERDPASFEVWGSVNGTTFTKIAAGTVPAFPERFIRREIYFDNATAYTTYKVIFPTVANAASANSMQVADVELLGYFGGTLAVVEEVPTLTFTRAANGDLVITYEGTLEESDSLVGGTWTTVSGASPVTITPTGSMKFYRAAKR
ncbi:MAG TPA: PA14 domain-containing protein [Candidatus Paceibacterota bacterium]|nr:PA14 domain-containing protein [Verrucomicrobiota bacterium]HRY46953.1 PA14 domain-containing protein [Candidatus Paceibacterota bacterium]